MTGEPIVPAVVVFKDIAPEKLKTLIDQFAPTITTEVVSITQEQGPKGSRAVLHCKASDAAKVQQMLIPLLLHRQMPTDIYIARKHQQAAQGMQAASFKAGICNHFSNHRACPFQGHCKFKCYDQ